MKSNSIVAIAFFCWLPFFALANQVNPLTTEEVRQVDRMPEQGLGYKNANSLMQEARAPKVLIFWAHRYKAVFNFAYAVAEVLDHAQHRALAERLLIAEFIPVGSSKWSPSDLTAFVKRLARLAGSPHRETRLSVVRVITGAFLTPVFRSGVLASKELLGAAKQLLGETDEDLKAAGVELLLHLPSLENYRDLLVFEEIAFEVRRKMMQKLAEKLGQSFDFANYVNELLVASSPELRELGRCGFSPGRGARQLMPVENLVKQIGNLPSDVAVDVLEVLRQAAATETLTRRALGRLMPVVLTVLRDRQDPLLSPAIATLSTILDPSWTPEDPDCPQIVVN